MTQHFLSIFNKETTTLNYTCDKDKTTSLLKVSGELSPLVSQKAKFIVTDGVLVKRFGLYPKGEVGEALSTENIELLEHNYSMTTTKHLNTSEKIEAVLKSDDKL